MNDTPDKSTWPEFAIVLFDLLTGRKAELTWEFDDLRIYVPISAGADPEYAVWKVNGAIKLRAREDYAG